MSLQPSTSPSNSREPPAERTKTSRPSGRLRSACDACHRAKTRCSGTSPCLSCQVSQTRCTYSPGIQPGRPKGSKNKRTLLLDKERNNEHTTETREDTSKNCGGADALQWSNPGREHQRQQQPDSMSIEFDRENGSDTTLTEDFAADGNYNLLFSPNLASLLDSTGGTRAFAALAQPLYHALPFDSSDSWYAAGTASSSTDDPTMSTPHSSSLPGGHSWPSGAFAPPESHHCSCLQQHVRLVYQLGDLQDPHAGGPTVDSVLRGVQQAQAPWQSLMHCSRCQSQDNQDGVFLLFATSIRTLLSSVQKLNVSSDHADASHDTTTGRAFSGPPDVAVSVGSFKLTGEMKAEVISVVIRRALQNITSALLHLWERDGRSRPSPIADHGNGNRAPGSPNGVLTGISTGSQMPLRRGSRPSANLGPEDVGHLLTTLQSTMQAMKQDLRGGSKRS
ncbi:hypothetical protein DL769_004043 [Monosporascus sp. CRB-8-3]|nr:hypothetical protein DL769_004043 [Monosporascus sp. CRB-8-3]